ncbi:MULTISPECIES: RHS repeat domain-containing protein [Sphingobacterium]|uniref:RHS repeat domain-containing protein n=1 Tax=Sphingobacterium TaxID=28453 RepID=UPI00257E55D9|nr:MULTISPECIES: RHS repeat-associated core domain-containing protein [Sphingobacterium]
MQFQYYVYDDFGDLRYVLPPGFTGTTFSETVSGDFFELIYAYKYDARKRVVRKKIPGKGWEYYVYNNNDQVVFTRDAEQVARGEWSFTKYDAQGRVILTGIEKGHTGDDQSSLQSSLSSFTGPLWEQRGSAMEGYTNNTMPQNTGNITVQAVNYYDNYTSIPGLPFTDHSTYSIRTQSLLVANKLLVLDSSPAKWLWTVNDYDDQGRIVKVSSTNHLDGTDIVTNEYNFSDQLVKSTRVHTPSTGTAVTLSTGNDYDHQGRLVQVRKKVNSQTEIIQSKLGYNEIGQLTTKSLHSENGGGNFMTSIAYAYNERGWQTKASSAQFTSLLNYNVNGTTVLANAQYNGNIAQQLWGYAATTNSTFNYSYDALNRLKNGVSTGTVMSEAMTYDDMGNIRTLIRDNGTMITYGYNNSDKSNRLNTLSGGLTGSFTYDQNGNATKDRTGMLLTYNQLNLPKTVIGGGKNIAYTYDALGTKLSRLSDVGGIKTQRDYISGIEYSKTGTGSPVIERIGTEDGFLLNSSGAYSYYYNLTDHLGNVRVVLKKGGTATVPTAAVMQKQDYYPFGKTKSIATSIDNKYLYNGKEMQADLNGGTHTLGSSYILEGQLDYGARFYDAEIGRWNVVDPLAEKFDSHTPYNYVGDNPVKRIDPNGEDWWDIIKGAAVAVADNMTQGALDNRKRTSYNSASDYNLGQDAGDIISAGVGALMTIDGAKNIAAGVVVTVGSGGTASIVSLPVAAAGSAEVVIGVGTLKNSMTNFATKKGRVTAEKSQNLEKSRDKGVPNSQIGPSGKPKVHNVSKANNKRAMDAAKNNPKSNTKPVKHSSDSGQKTHYHSTRDGEKQGGKDNIHYEDRSTKRNK